MNPVLRESMLDFIQTIESTRCLICHRKLTNPKSIERKMGEICAKKYEKGTVGIQSKIEV